MVCGFCSNFSFVFDSGQESVIGKHELQLEHSGSVRVFKNFGSFLWQKGLKNHVLCPTDPLKIIQSFNLISL